MSALTTGDSQRHHIQISPDVSHKTPKSPERKLPLHTLDRAQEGINTAQSAALDRPYWSPRHLSITITSQSLRSSKNVQAQPQRLSAALPLHTSILHHPESDCLGTADLSKLRGCKSPSYSLLPVPPLSKRNTSSSHGYPERGPPRDADEESACGCSGHQVASVFSPSLPR
jgi:hypothetical protein